MMNGNGWEQHLSEDQIEILYEEALALLQDLIRTPSLSGQEKATGDLLESVIRKAGLTPHRIGNNIWSRSEPYDPALPTLLLNSHHDTVPAGHGYSRSPFDPAIVDGQLFGLGSNDAGASLASLLAVFCYLGTPVSAGTDEGADGEDIRLPSIAVQHLFNLLFIGSAEEESSGENGIPLPLGQVGPVDFGIIGEPTGMKMAIAEKGLLVLDCTAHGRRGHAAREEGVNAIYNAMKDIEWFRTYHFERVSELLGPVRMTTTMIEAGARHNIVPDECLYTVDVRTTDAYTSEETLEIINRHVDSTVRPRSLRLNPSTLSTDHPAVDIAGRLGIETYGSPTLSDQAQMSFPTAKIGPGESARSHTDDEFIYLQELKEGIRIYLQIIGELAQNPNAWRVAGGSEVTTVTSNSSASVQSGRSDGPVASTEAVSS